MANKVMRVIAKVALHLVVVIAVLVAPPIIYNIITLSDGRDHNGVEFVGALTYPIYFLYWIAKLNSSRAKFILAYLVGFLVVAAMVMGLSGRSTPLVVLLIPAMVGVLPLLLALCAGVARNRHFALTCLWTALIVVPLGGAISVLVVYGSAMASVGNIRY